MFNTPELLQTAPEGNPAEDVGIVFIERLFTKVVHTLSEVILDPTINEQAKEAVFDLPPKIAAEAPLAVFKEPPRT
jgi:hypothetical protein